MASTALSIGIKSTIQQNRSYALPAKMVIVTSNLAVQTSVDEITWNALTGAETAGAQTGASFIRCAVGNAVVICKEAGKDAVGWNSQYISFGSAPAKNGEIRLSPGNSIRSRRSDGFELDLLSIGNVGNETLVLGSPNAATVVGGYFIIPIGIHITESAEPGAAGNAGMLFCKDNGSGKTQLMVKFGTGAAIQLAIEP